MAKEMQCPLCGKQIVKKFMGNEHDYVNLGEYSITCCAECGEKYNDFANTYRKMMEAKIYNFKYKRKQKMDDQTLSQLFLQFYKEAQKYLETMSVATYSRAFYCFDDNGHFAITESKLGSSNRDISAKDMLKSFKKSQQNDIIYFTKADIDRIEYCILSGAPLGIFKTAFPVMVRLNDHKVMTFKPCISKTAVIGKGIFKKRSADKQAYQQLVTFCQDIKASNIPIVRVKNFI